MAIPRSSSVGISGCNCSWVRVSDTVTRTPRDCRKSAEATPDLPSPTTSTRFPFTSIPCIASAIFSAQLQSCKSKECKHQCRDPEAGDHLRLRPAHQLKVMMQRRHLEDTLLPQF